MGDLLVNNGDFSISGVELYYNYSDKLSRSKIKLKNITIYIT